MAKIIKYIHPDQILFLTLETHDDVIGALIDALNKKGRLKDAEAFKQAIIEREKIVTTGIGMGVAIPHAKLPGYNDFFIAIGILGKGVEGVDWKAIDNEAVRLIFLIGGPDDKQTEYLQILSALTMALKDEDRRKKLLATHQPEEVMALFREF